LLEAFNWLENKLGWGIDYKIDITRAIKGDHIWYMSNIRKFKNDYQTRNINTAFRIF